jgi:hypothetical protein
MDLAVVVVLALWAVVAVVAVGAGQPGASAVGGRESASGSPVLPIGLMDAVKVALAWLAAWRSRDSGRCMLRFRCPIALSAM